MFLYVYKYCRWVHSRSTNKAAICAFLQSSTNLIIYQLLLVCCLISHISENNFSWYVPVLILLNCQVCVTFWSMSTVIWFQILEFHAHYSRVYQALSNFIVKNYKLILSLAAETWVRETLSSLYEIHEMTCISFHENYEILCSKVFQNKWRDIKKMCSPLIWLWKKTQDANFNGIKMTHFCHQTSL